MSLNRAATAAVLMFALSASPGRAGPTIDQYVTFSGFGTLGAVHSVYRQADFTGTLDQPRGAGYSNPWSLTPDTDLGGQANLTLTHALSGVVQVLARDSAGGNFSPEIEWANLKYEITPDLAVRVGRMILPTYERSDIRNVGYALPWVRVPAEITYTSTATHSDGVDVLYRVTTGVLKQNFQAQWGTAKENLPGAAFNTVRAHVAVLSDTIQHGDASLHLVYQQCDPLGSPRARLRLFGAGFTYDPGQWFVTGDSNRTKDIYFGDFLAWYMSAGVRFGRFAPYTTYSATRATAVGRSGLTALGNEHAVAAGVRWDFAKSLDFKLQLERQSIDTLDDPAAFANLQRGAGVGDKAMVLSLALDIVF